MGDLIILAIVIYLAVKAYQAISVAWLEAMTEKLPRSIAKKERDIYRRTGKTVRELFDMDPSQSSSGGTYTSSSASARSAPRQDFQQHQAIQGREAQLLIRRAESEEVHAAKCRAQASDMQSRSSGCRNEAATGDTVVAARARSEAQSYQREADRLPREAQAAEEQTQSYHRQAAAPLR